MSRVWTSCNILTKELQGQDDDYYDDDDNNDDDSHIHKNYKLKIRCEHEFHNFAQ